MNHSEILAKVDHTLLSQTATWEQIKAICDEAIKLHTASVCIPPCYVKQAKEYVRDQLTICTVIGFPNGYQTAETKLFETQNEIENGADEIDMVISICQVKNKEYDMILDEIRQVKNVCGNHILKVIIETCLLTKEEKIKLCEIVTQSGADYIKTSTGFSTGGATREDIQLFREHIGAHVKMKAAGGISTLQDAEDFIHLGCDRLGTSRIIKLVQNQTAEGY